MWFNPIFCIPLIEEGAAQGPTTRIRTTPLCKIFQTVFPRWVLHLSMFTNADGPFPNEQPFLLFAVLMVASLQGPVEICCG